MQFFLKTLARLSTRYPWVVLLTAALLTAAAVYPAYRAVTHMESDLTRLMPKNLPASAALNETRNQFPTADLRFWKNRLILEGSRTGNGNRINLTPGADQPSG